MSDPNKEGIIVSADGGDITIKSDSHISASASLALSANLNQIALTPARFSNHISLELHTYLGAWLELTFSATAAAVAEVTDVAEKIEIKLNNQTVAAQAARNVGTEQELTGSALENSAAAQVIVAEGNALHAQLIEADNDDNTAVANASQAGGQSAAVTGDENVINSLRNILVTELKDINAALTEIDTAFNSVTSKASQYVAGLNQVKGGILAV
jgi:hypothetical protein